MGLISFILNRFVLKGQSSELGKYVYSISLSYSGNHLRQFTSRGSTYREIYACSFDTRVWAHDVDEAVERAKEKWMESERKLIAEGARGRILVPKERMRYSPN